MILSRRRTPRKRPRAATSTCPCDESPDACHPSTCLCWGQSPRRPPPRPRGFSPLDLGELSAFLSECVAELKALRPCYLSRYSLSRPHDCRKARHILTRHGWCWSRCQSPTCSKACKRLYARRLSRAVLRGLRARPELEPNLTFRITPPRDMSWDKYRELLKRLPDRLRTRLGSLEYLRVTHWRRRRPHTHFVAWADATADELRAALKAVLNSFGGGFTEGGPIDRPGSYSVDYIEDVIALVRYVTEDTAEGGELVPEDYTGDTATTSRDFLGHPIKYLDDELKRADLERRYHRWLDRASRGNPKRRQWLARLYPLPPRPIAPPDHPNGRPPGRPDPAVFAAQAAEVEARLNPPRPPPDPPPDDPTDGVPADDNDDSDPEAEGWAELDAFRLEMEADGWSLDDEAAYESYLARAERLGLA